MIKTKQPVAITIEGNRNICFHFHNCIALKIYIFFLFSDFKLENLEKKIENLV